MTKINSEGINLNPIPEKSVGDRPARSDERESENEPGSKVPSNDEYYSPEDVVDISDKAKKLSKEEIDPQ